MEPPPLPWASASSKKPSAFWNDWIWRMYATRSAAERRSSWPVPQRTCSTSLGAYGCGTLPPGEKEKFAALPGSLYCAIHRGTIASNALTSYTGLSGGGGPEGWWGAGEGAAGGSGSPSRT